MTVAVLRKELEKRGLDTAGLKAALVARLEEAEEGGGGAAAAAPEVRECMPPPPPPAPRPAGDRTRYPVGACVGRYPPHAPHRPHSPRRIL
jgi:hypothetical protein